MMTVRFLALAGLCLTAVAGTPASFAAPNAAPADDFESLLREHAAERHVDHRRMAQASANDCRTFSPKVSPAQIAAIGALLGQRGHRLQHALWHATRGGLDAKDEKDEISAFGNDWGQSHPFCPAPAPNFNAADYNPVGEDFLYMHRRMIGAVRDALIHHEPPLPCIEGWTRVPTLGEAPLPDGDTRGAKSPAALRQLRAWDKALQDRKWLASHSLSQLGMAAEFTTHNNLHMRYATTLPPAGFPGIEQTGGAPIPFDGRFPADWPYDRPSYDWLADPYGAALNPYFWKIHGYVDHLIDLWLAANGFDRIEENCEGAPKCYQWRGTWTGNTPRLASPASAAEKSGSPARTPYSRSCDERTRRFNQKRMLRQWTGVLGEHPMSGNHFEATLPTRAADAVHPDPFVYAAGELCSRED